MPELHTRAIAPPVPVTPTVFAMKIIRSSFPFRLTHHAFLLGCAVLAPVCAQAAPGPAEVKPAEEKPAEEKLTEEREKRAERAKQERAKRAEEMRLLMASFGFEDRALQDSILNYIREEIRARSLLRRHSAALYQMLREKDATDEALKAALTAYNEALEIDRERRLHAEDDLNVRINFRARPRLEAMLTLFGVVGEGASALSLRPRIPGPR